MKKLLFILLFPAFLLTGCEKNTQKLTSADFYELTDNTTHDGVQVGDGASEFIKAYSDYTVQTAYTDVTSSYVTMSIREIPYDENISTLIANFFIDGDAVSEESICEENEIDDEDLYDLLSSSSYLRAHEVIYRYLRFTWADSVITDIDSGELNYNETFEIPRMES
ncbi:MAG: hypothetical protein LUI07_01590 [Lachnospiraceae bacterium]|nr:hypothetical protein [Lachnospiraceae bacterium]